MGAGLRKVGYALTPDFLRSESNKRQHDWEERAEAERKKKEVEDLAPPPTTDLTDEMVRAAQAQKMTRLLAQGRGRRSTFLGGPGGGSLLG